MTPEEALSELLGVTYVLAEDIYFRKCLFYNVPSLSDDDKKRCIEEAVESLPRFLDGFVKMSDALKGRKATNPEFQEFLVPKCVAHGGCNEFRSCDFYEGMGNA